MPPFNPALIGAPSPVGRGGGGGDLPLGAIGNFLSDPGPKFAKCSGLFAPLSAAQIAAVGVEPQVRTMGPVDVAVMAGGSYNGYNLAYREGTYVVLTGQSGTAASRVLVTDNDGASFTEVSTTYTYMQYDIRTSPGWFYIRTENGLIASSNRGRNWALYSNPDGLNAPNVSFQGNDCALIYYSQLSPKRLYTVRFGSTAYSQCNLPSDLSQLFNIVYIDEVGLYYVVYRNTSGTNCIVTTKDLLDYSTPKLVYVDGAKYAFGMLAGIEGLNVVFRDLVTLNEITRVAANVGSVYGLTYVNGVLVTVGSGGIGEIVDPYLNGFTLYSGDFRAIASSTRGYIALANVKNAFVGAPREPNGIRTPRMYTRKSPSGALLTPYMRVA